jgi:hypothetical protein
MSVSGHHDLPWVWNVLMENTLLTAELHERHEKINAIQHSRLYPTTTPSTVSMSAPLSD